MSTLMSMKMSLRKKRFLFCILCNLSRKKNSHCFAIFSHARNTFNLSSCRFWPRHYRLSFYGFGSPFSLFSIYFPLIMCLILRHDNTRFISRNFYKRSQPNRRNILHNHCITQLFSIVSLWQKIFLLHIFNMTRKKRRFL